MADARRLLRLFVACELPEELASALGRVQADLRRLGGERLRWVRPEAIHLTLKFLGDVETDQLDELITTLGDAIEPFRLRLRLNRLGGFGGRRLRVVWVDLNGDVEDLADLAETIHAALVPLGFARDGRPFVPHLTLARVPDRVQADDRARLAELLSRYELPALTEISLTEVSLVRSDLGPGGAVYSVLATFPP